MILKFISHVNWTLNGTFMSCKVYWILISIVILELRLSLLQIRCLVLLNNVSLLSPDLYWLTWIKKAATKFSQCKLRRGYLINVSFQNVESFEKNLSLRWAFMAKVKLTPLILAPNTTSLSARKIWGKGFVSWYHLWFEVVDNLLWLAFLMYSGLLCGEKKKKQTKNQLRLFVIKVVLHSR